MQAVLISIHPKWCEYIASGKKTVEVRKTKPKLKTPFKVYIYCTKGRGDCLWRWNGIWYDTQDPNHRPNRLDGKVIGEFVCDKIDKIFQSNSGWVQEHACISREEYFKYLGLPYNSHFDSKGAYAWHISNLVIYDKPRELSEFSKHGFGCPVPLKRPFQSWGYVEVEK